MVLLLYQNFFGSFNTDCLTNNIKDKFQIKYYKNDFLIYSYRYENSKLIERIDFEREENHRRVFEYYENYIINTVYSVSGDISKKKIILDNVFNVSECQSFSIKDDDGWGVRILKDGSEEISLANSDQIVYRFKNKLLTKIIFNVSGYENSYVIDAEYDDENKLIYQNKRFLKIEFDYLNKEKWFEYDEDLMIEKKLQEGKMNFKLTQYDEKKRPLKIVSFINNEEELHLVKAYMKNSNEETLQPVMKFINLEIYEYDQFDNKTVYEEMFYRPDFSKDSLTYYIQEYNYYDKYNINYGKFYCRTKTDYDDYDESESRLEYLDNKVNQYTNEKLTAIHHLKNEKKIKSEFFIKDSYEFDKYNDDGEAEYVNKDLYVIEKYDKFGNAIESSVKNEKTGEIDYYKIEVIYQ